MNLNDAFPSKYLKADVDVMEDQPITVTIKDVGMEKLGMGSDAQDKLVVALHEFDKKLVLNKTNSTTIAKLYGDETDDWVGQRITLYATEVQFKDEMVMSIRVKGKKPGAGPGKAVPMGVGAAVSAGSGPAKRPQPHPSHDPADRSNYPNPTGPVDEDADDFIGPDGKTRF